jgi:hypothetical protein
MFNLLLTRMIVTTLLIVVGATGCAERLLRSSHSQSPRPAARAAAPSILSITPRSGSTAGYTPMRITGTGFQSGATITLDGATLQGRFENRSNARLYLQTPSHPAGTVDVLVTNPDGQTNRLTGGYTYVSPESFDFNGNWSGVGRTDHHTPIRFTIKNNRLVSLSCDTFTTLMFSPRPAVTNGEFSVSQDNGIAVAGRIVSDSAAVGIVNLARCPTTRWSATRQ